MAAINAALNDQAAELEIPPEEVMSKILNSQLHFIMSMDP